MAETDGLPRSRPLSWVSRDAWTIIAARGLRTFAQASVGVLIGIYLTLLGFDYIQVGLFISIGLAGGAVFSTLIAFVGDAFGRRRLLALFTLFTGAAGLALAFSDQFIVLAAVMFLGSFNAAGGAPTGPVQPLEQAALPETVAAERRTRLFGLYSIVSTGTRALGSLAAGLPLVFEHLFGMEQLTAYRVMFGGFAVIGAVAALLYARLSPAIELASVRRHWTNPFKLPSRRRIFTMSALFSTDTFATRLVPQSLVALWFYERFGIDVAAIGFLYFLTEVLHTVSMWVAVKAAERFGLLNTIIYSHIPAVLFVAIFPFMPSAPLAMAAWLGRGFFSQMDGPTRHSYTMGVVGADERSAMAGFNNMGQNIASTASPTVTTLFWSIGWTGVPFLVSAGLKSVYLAGFYATFHGIKPPEEHGASPQPESRATLA